METDWRERFKAVVTCVYCVLLDQDEIMHNLKEHLFQTNKIGRMEYKSWPRDCPKHAKADALNSITARLTDMTNAVMNADKEPTVKQSAVRAAFEKIKACIEEMPAQVQSVEQEYGWDCGVLKLSIEAALTALQTYLEDEKTEEKTVAQLVEDLGELVDKQL